MSVSLPSSVRHYLGEVRAAVLLGKGSDHIAWLVNDEVVVRQAKTPDAGAIRREATLLGVVGRFATLPVPEVVYVDADAGILAYRHIAGTPLMDAPDTDTVRITTQLGGFLDAIHGIPLAQLQGTVAPDDAPLVEWLEEARGTYPGIAGHLPEQIRPRIEGFLASSPPAEPEIQALCHNDFGAEHILVDPETMQIAGIIDWADAAIADPMRDLALILRDLGPHSLDAALGMYRRPLTAADRERLTFHARCKLIEDIAFGIATGESRYLDAALAHLHWTFGPQ